MRIVGGVLGVLLALSGCSQATDTAQGATALQQQIDDSWSDFHSAHPDVERPQVEVVRVISMEEWSTVIADCLVRAGFAVTESYGGIAYDTVPTAQAEPFALAQYVCSATYPLDPKYNAEPTDDQLRTLYDYRVGTLTSCLEEQGYAIEAPPSFQKFVENDGGWSPYDQLIMSGVFDLSAMQKICPELPDGYYD
jgi:hypothetical protein